MTDTLPTTPAHEGFKPHPLLPLPAPEDIARDLQDPAKRPKLLKFLNGRAAMLRAAVQDPLHHGLRLPDSRRVDELLEQYQILYESGGKRAGKTYDGIPRFLRCAEAYGKAKRWAMQDNNLSSIANLQQLVWEYLPQSTRRLNMKRDRLGKTPYRVHYTPDNGFDGVLILPNGCEIYFLNYTQNPQDFLGWELGKALDVPLRPGVPDIGALLDENCPLAWLLNIQLRCSTRGAKIHWMYSPQDGITPTIKDLKTNAKTTESRPAELLQDRVNVPGLPKGHMPVVQVDQDKRLAIFYRFTEHNPFSGYANPGGVRELCQTRHDISYTMAHAYGYCEAVKGRVFPLFGEWNVIPHDTLPADGTNYMATDPGGARNWFTLWVRVPPGSPQELYVYREWPDYQSYGDWAITSNNPRKFNGERGPAQTTIGYGPAEYKKLFLQLEKIVVPSPLREARTWSEPELDQILRAVADPWQRRRLRQALQEGETLDDLRERIYERLIDPRAARARNATEKANQCLQDILSEPSRNEKTGEEIAPRMDFICAPGLDLVEGLSQLASYLYFDRMQPRTPLLNSPRLFVSDRCRNLIWCMNTYSLPSDTSGTDDACEDPIDDLRYIVTHGVRYVMPGGKIRTTGPRGGY